MVVQKLMDLTSNVIQKSFTYYAIGKDIWDYSNRTIKRHLGSEEEQTNIQESRSEKQDELEKRREQLIKQMEIPEANDSFIQSRQQSMLDSQGIADHSGSSYHGPGKPGEKSNSNMWHRNYENHQGN